MIISVVSGKGGVGKTFFVSLIGREISKRRKVTLMDADVENPNLNSFFKYKLRLKKIVYSEYPTLDKKKCRKCGICFRKCRLHAIAWSEGKYPIFFEENCKGCLLCKEVCPYDAIKVRKEVIGYIREGGRNPRLIEGRSRIGVEETSKVVKELLNLERGLTIVDTPAGLRCNVLHILKRSDVIIFLAEPTPFGIEDLRRVLTASKDIEARKFLVINKVGIGKKDKIYEISREYGIEVLLEIPYSEEIAKQCSVGRIPALDLGEKIEGIIG